MVVGGKLFEELGRISHFQKLALEFQRAGIMRVISRESVDRRTEEIKATGLCKSNDPHIIALAQVSRARLLFSNDEDLNTDFKTKALLDSPRGKVLTTDKDAPVKYREFSARQRKLLNNKICAMP